MEAPPQHVRGDVSNPVAPPPPAPVGVALSARPGGPLRGRFPGAFRADLLTGAARGRSDVALWGPALSVAVDLEDLVRIEETQSRRRFPDGLDLLRFEYHLPGIHTSRVGC